VDGVDQAISAATPRRTAFERDLHARRALMLRFKEEISAGMTSINQLHHRCRSALAVGGNGWSATDAVKAASGYWTHTHALASGQRGLVGQLQKAQIDTSPHPPPAELEDLEAICPRRVERRHLLPAVAPRRSSCTRARLSSGIAHARFDPAAGLLPCWVAASTPGSAGVLRLARSGVWLDR